MGLLLLLQHVWTAHRMTHHTHRWRWLGCDEMGEGDYINVYACCVCGQKRSVA